MTLADLVYIDSTGYHFADYPTFLEWRKQQYRDIYGADIYLEADSQDGQLVAIQAKSDYDTAALGASVYNSFSPTSAQGTGLARNVKINGLTKRSATKSSVDLTIVGVTGTTISKGVAIDVLNQKWDLPDTVLIPGGGMTVVTAFAQDEGAIEAAANTVTSIFTPTLGWQTVDNDDPATVGVGAETDAELRARQKTSTANPSLTVFEGTIGGVGNLPGVTAVRGYENDTGITDGNGIPEHSICLIVAGGVSADVAQEIALHKTPGTGTYGTTTELVFDSHGMPINISFSRPVVKTIKAQVTIAAGDGWSADYAALIKDAVAAQINAFGIGTTILITKLFAPAYLFGTAPGQTYDVVLLEIAIDGDPLGDINIPLDFDEQPICVAADDVTIVVT